MEGADSWQGMNGNTGGLYKMLALSLRRQLTSARKKRQLTEKDGCDKMVKKG